MNRYKPTLFQFVFVIALINNCYEVIADGNPTLYAAQNFNAVDDAAFLQAAINARDEQAINSVLTKRVSFQRVEIAKAYANIYEKNLANELKRILDKNDEDYDKIIVALMTPLPDYHAKVLHEAIYSHHISRSEDIPEILCMKNNAEVSNVMKAYEKTYGKLFIDECSGEIEFVIYITCVLSRFGSKGVNKEQAVSDAKKLFNSGREQESYAFSSIVTPYRHPQQLSQTFLEYKDISGQNFKDAYEKELQDGSLMEYFLRKIVLYITSDVESFVGRLHASLELDPYTVARIIIWRSEIDLGDIKELFEKRYNSTLESRIEHISSKYRALLKGFLGTSNTNISAIQV